MQETETTYKTQNLYTYLENIDRLQNLWLQAWTDKQKDLEEKRRECLSSMVTMFPKVGLPHWGVSTAGRDVSWWGVTGGRVADRK